MGNRIEEGLCVMCGKKLKQNNRSVFRSVCTKCAEKIEAKAARKFK